MNPFAAGILFQFSMRPKLMGRIEVYKDSPSCTDEQMTCNVVAYVLSFVYKKYVTCWPMYFTWRIYAKELYY